MLAVFVDCKVPVTLFGGWNLWTSYMQFV
jgi:hypothetical protein